MQEHMKVLSLCILALASRAEARCAQYPPDLAVSFDRADEVILVEASSMETLENTIPDRKVTYEVIERFKEVKMTNAMQ